MSVLPPLDPLLRTSLKRTRDVFAAAPNDGLQDDQKRLVPMSFLFLCAQKLIVCLSQSLYSSTHLKLTTKVNDEYKYAITLPSALLAQQRPVGPVGPANRTQQGVKAITAGRKFKFSLDFQYDINSLPALFSIYRFFPCSDSGSPGAEAVYFNVTIQP